MAKKYWKTANDPPETSRAGQTSNVCFQVHMQLTMYSGTMSDRNGNWCPAMTESVSVGSASVTPLSVMSGVPSPP